MAHSFLIQHLVSSFFNQIIPGQAESGNSQILLTTDCNENSGSGTSQEFSDPADQFSSFQPVIVLANSLFR